jgi:hypothetical protein
VTNAMREKIHALTAQAQREMMSQHTAWLRKMDAAADQHRPDPPKPHYQPSRVTRRRMDEVMRRLDVATWDEAQKAADEPSQEQPRLKLVRST